MCTMEEPDRREFDSNVNTDSDQPSLLQTFLSKQCSKCGGSVCEKCSDQHKTSRSISTCELISDLCCNTFVTLRHGRQQEAHMIKGRDEYAFLTEKLHSILKQKEHRKDKLDENRFAIHTTCDEMLEEIQQFRAEINAKLDEMDQRIRYEVKHCKRHTSDRLNFQQTRLEIIVDKVQILIEWLNKEEHKHKDGPLLKVTEKAKYYIKEYEKELETVGYQLDEQLNKLCSFTRNSELEMLLSQETFGTIDRNPQSRDEYHQLKDAKSQSDNKEQLPKTTRSQSVHKESWSEEYVQKGPSSFTSPVYAGEINISHPKDATSCWITGCIEINKDLVAITDHKNSSIKVVDIDGEKIISYTKLEAKPWDITLMDDNRIVVTSEGKLLFLTKAKDMALTVEREVPMTGLCSGIDHYKGLLVVSFLDPKPAVKIIDTRGNILSYLPMPIERSPLASPFYVRVSSRTRDLYVSDYDRNEVTCISLQGVVKGSLKLDTMLRGPYGLACDRQGGVFVASCGSSNVNHITGACARITTVVRSGAKGAIDCPQAVVFCRKSNKLVISHNQLAENHQCQTSIRNIVNSLSVFKFYDRFLTTIISL